MTASVLQENQNSTNSSVTSLAVTLAGVTAGSSIGVLVTADDTAGTTSATVSDGTAYTSGNAQHNPTFQQFSQSFYLQNVSAGSHTITVTLDNFHPAVGIWAVEVGGVATASFDGKNVSEQTTPTTGTDAVTVTSTPASTKQPALVLAWSFSVANNPAPAAGTGFTAGATAWNFTAGNQCRSESKRVTATGTQTATFTAGVNTSHDTFILVFDELGASAGTSPGGFDGLTAQPRAPRGPVRSQESPLPGLPAVAAIPWGFDVTTQRLPSRAVARPSIDAPLPPLPAPAFGFDHFSARPPSRTSSRPTTIDPLPAIIAPSVGPWGFDSSTARMPTRPRPISLQSEPLPAPKLLWPLSIHSSGRYFIDASGAPFFNYGISAWSIFTEPADYRPLVDAAAALDIKMLLVRFIDKTTHNAPNLRDGTAPFNTPGDFTTLNSAYAIRFRDFLRYCASRGIFVWVAFAYDGFAGAGTDGWRPEKVTNGTTGCNTLGLSIGTVLAQEQNFGAVPGGDFTPGGTDHLDQNLIAGLQTNAPQATLVMAHPDQSARSPQWAVSDDYPNVTSTVRGCYSWFGDTGGNNRTIYTVGRSQYNASPARPVVYLEAEYFENTLGSQLGTTFTTRFQAIAFWLETVNGFGPGVGAEGFWPALLTADPHGTIPPQAQGKDWPTSIADAVLTHLQNVKGFAVARQWHLLAPDQGTTLATAGRGTYGTDSYRNAALASDGSFGVIYLPTGTTGGTVTANMARFRGPVLARWFSPSTGSYTAINGGVRFQATGTQVFTAPDTSDWLLALDADALVQFVEHGSAAKPATRTAARSSLVEPLPAIAGATALGPFGFDSPARPRPTVAPVRSTVVEAFPSAPAFVGGFDSAAVVRAPPVAPRSTSGEVFPSLVTLTPWGWDQAPGSRAAPGSVRPSADALSAILAAVVGPWGWDTTAAPLVRRIARSSSDPGVLPVPAAPVVLVAWGYDSSTARMLRITAPRSALAEPLPDLPAVVALVAWGFDFGTSQPRPVAAQRLAFVEPWSAIVAPPALQPWGSEASTFMRQAIVSRRSQFADPIPSLVTALAWGWESQSLATVRPARPRASSGDTSPSTAAFPPWGWDHVPSRPSAAAAARFHISEPLPPLVILTPWGFDYQTRALPGRVTPTPRFVDPLPEFIVPPPIGPWGWSDATTLTPRIIAARTLMSEAGYFPGAILLFSAVAPRERTIIVLPHSRVFKVRAK